MSQRKRILWGILLVLVGVAVALISLGVITLPFEISAWRIILGIAVLSVLIEGLSRLDFAQAFIMAGIEVMIFEKELGALLGMADENWISNWTVLLISALVGIGFNMIFKGVKRHRKIRKCKTLNVNAFSDHLKYIDCSKMKWEYVRNTFGDFEVRFENVDDYKGGAELTADNSFGEMVIYVPSDWEVSVNVDNTFGDLTVDDVLKVGYADGSAKKLVIKGTNRFGDMTIRAI